MLPTVPELIQKYDDYFTKDPDKWAGDPRNEFCFNAVRTYPYIERIIDAGCGNGHSLLYFYNKWGLSAQYAGIDMSPVACELARKKVPTADIRCGLIEDCEFEKPFDLVLLLGVLEHMDQEDMWHKKSLAAI
jgi:2-polyprenyl-3-methyl-5-hydroxy-6-metoxy-1,4-benzoquinol methylase